MLPLLPVLPTSSVNAVSAANISFNIFRVVHETTPSAFQDRRNKGLLKSLRSSLCSFQTAIRLADLVVIRKWLGDPQLQVLEGAIQASLTTLSPYENVNLWGHFTLQEWEVFANKVHEHAEAIKSYTFIPEINIEKSNVFIYSSEIYTQILLLRKQNQSYLEEIMRDGNNDPLLYFTEIFQSDHYEDGWKFSLIVTKEEMNKLDELEWEEWDKEGNHKFGREKKIRALELAMGEGYLKGK